MDDLGTWIRAASKKDGRAKAEDRWGIGLLDDQLLETLINDITDVDGGLTKSKALLDRLLEGEPSPSQLESALVECEVEIAHMVHHWRRLIGLLKEQSLWMDDDFFDSQSR